MTPMTILISLFPGLHAVSCILLLLTSLFFLSPFFFLSFLFSLYFVPPLLFRLHNLLWPLKPSYSNLAEKRYSPWYGSHQIQLLFIAIPSIEALLRLIPGLYSFWLRLWGADIGKNIHWTPRVEVIDRPLLKIGDNVVIGHLVVFCSHYITPHKGKLSLYVAPVEVGDNAFIGASTRFSPGSKVSPNTFLKYNTECWPNKTYS